jgi:hypothetical protein
MRYEKVQKNAFGNFYSIAVCHSALNATGNVSLTLNWFLGFKVYIG